MDIVISDAKDSPVRSPNCLKCVHFRVTWDNSFPRSCGVFQIKSKNLPSVEIFNATRRQCPSFELKPGIK
ncbi:hypothetical protein AGMMS50212_08290 [Spirochaetia bacterium]|nr:hypothetical protein AGMMS50212_08290 [Spirochaetia bacterium]